MQYSHIGWTPCINGHLDFGLVKPGIHGGFTNSNVKDKKTTRINYSYNGIYGSHARKVILQSKVEWKDTLGNDFDGQMRVFLIGEVSESRFLDKRAFSGSLFVYSEYLMAQEHETPSKITEKVYKKFFPERYSMSIKSKYPWFGKIHEAKGVFESTEDGTPKDHVRLNKVCQQLMQELRNIDNICHEVIFEVTSNGITYLKLSDKALNILNDEEQYGILRQAFYYIKYSIHDHKHHDGQADSLTTIIQYEDSISGRRDASIRLIGQLKRELTQIKRTFSSGDKYHAGDALGIIAYTRSLCVTLKHLGFLGEKLFQREMLYLESLSQSFKAQIDKIDKADRYIEIAKSTSRVHLGWILSVTSLISVILFRSYVNISDKEKFDVNISLLESVTVFIFFLAILFFAYDRYSKSNVSRILDEGAVKFWINENYIKEPFPYYTQKMTLLILKFAFGLITLAISVSIFLEYKEPPISCDNTNNFVSGLCFFLGKIKNYISIFPKLF